MSTDSSGVEGIAAEVTAAIESAQPGCRLSSGPTPFGWAPDHHFRAALSEGGRVEQVVIRRSWSVEVHEKETRLYREVLPRLSVRTAALLGTFETRDDGPGWMILEDLGHTGLDAGSRGGREALLAALGRLHAESRALAERDLSAWLPRFQSDSPEHSSWVELLETRVGALGIEEWMPGLARVVFDELADQTPVLLHGDMDLSNFLVVDGGAAFIDWEKGQLGPPGVDLGPVMEHVEESRELDSYLRAWPAEEGTSAPSVERWAQTGEGYDCLRWICYFLTRASTDSDPGPEWREQYYEPRIHRLGLLRDRL